MTVRELNPEQPQALKVSLYYDPSAVMMNKSQPETCMRADFPSEIPDELVHEVFDGVQFVEDDFFL